jgi:hypothetical protein
MRYKLIAIGRDKFNGEVEVKDFDELESRVRPLLLSRDIDILFDSEDSKIGEIGTVYAGFNCVGTVERIS